MRVVLVISLCILCTVPAYAGKEKKLLKKARLELAEGNYDKAKEYYGELLKINPDNSEYQFETGLTYYTSRVEMEKSVGYFKTALQKSGNDTIAEIFFYLGRAYQYTGEFEKAIRNYNHFRKFVENNNEGIVLSRDINRYVEMCNNGIALTQNPNHRISIHNLKNGVNSEGAEYAPLVKDDESLLIFTGRREESTGGKTYHDNQEYEDIYISKKVQDEWTRATKFDSSNLYINKNINTKWHDAAIAFNQTEDKLYIYRKNHVWVSELKEGKWADPVKMNKNVNSSYHEPSVYISPDENTLLVVSTDREDGFGGRDIWITNKQTSGEWGELMNLGPNINTEFDEDAPFLTNDGKTLYFSSKGHTSMGGYDVFKSDRQSDGSWSTPVNLGAPINSPGDDIYYVETDNGLNAYYSSSRTGGYGDMDIYMIQLDCKSLPSTEIKGVLMAGNKQFPIGGEIVIKNESGEEIRRYPVDPATGKYLMVLSPEETYKLELIAENPWYVIRPHEETFTIPKQCDPYPLYQEIHINRLKNEEGKIYAQEARFQNAFFNFEDTVSTHYEIAGKTDNYWIQLERDYNIGGTLKFNEALAVDRGARIYLLNSRNEIIRISETNYDGHFIFRDLDEAESYKIALDENDLKYLYYGTSPVNADNGLIVRGTINQVTRNEQSVPLDSFNIYLFDANKIVTNLTQTENGLFSLDNMPTETADLESINNEAPFTYNIDSEELDYAISAFITTVDPENNEINYTEYVDIIELPEIEDPASDVSFDNIYFDFDKYFLRQKSENILQNILNYMTSHTEVTIKVDGHTDWFGTEEYNQQLSENRANSAYNFLVKNGIDKDRIKKEWFGETIPAVPNANPDGTDNPDNRQLNRRVEFKITTKDMAFTLSL